MNEDPFRERIINDLEKKGITCINLHGGTFDIYIPIFKKFIECKKISNFEYKPKMTNKSGTVFTKHQTNALRKLSKLQECEEFPIVAVMDDTNNKENYYFISSKELKEHTIKREKFDNYMAISISHFTKKLLYNELLNELTRKRKK